MSRTSFGKVKISTQRDGDIEHTDTEYFQGVGNWRNVIFLPHNILWKLLIVFTVVTNCMLVSFNLFFYDESQWFITLYYIFEVLYFANVVLVSMHRFMQHQKTQVHVPKPIGLILIDILTLLPYYEVHYLLKSKSTTSLQMISRDYMRPKVIFRLTSVIYFFYTASNETDLNHIVLTITKQTIVLSVYAMFVSGLWFNLSKWQESVVSWRGNLRYHQFNQTSMLDWYLISASTIGNCLAHNWAGVISPQTTIEAIIICVTMVFGYLMHVMILFGQLIAQYIKKIEDQFEFSYRLHVITRMLDNWDVDTNKKNSVIDAYNIFWEKRKGQRTMPVLFKALPKSLQLECTLDTFWHFVKHARIFGEMDFAFIRHMSHKMTSHYHMPGEYLYQLNELKGKMVYIVSGVVQILSQEDQESPVMSFSGGTVLSELCCVMATYSNVNIRCATYCEIQTLDIVSFCRLLMKYPGVRKKLHQRFRDRLSIAKKMQHPELMRLKNKEQRRTSIRWIKTQWRNIMSLTKAAKKGFEDKQKYIVPHHISKYLHLYVLSNDVELKVSAICLRSKCPFVFEPTSTFRAFCDYVVLFATILQCLMIPYIAVFRRKLTLQERGFLYMVDIIFVLGLYIELSTAVNVSGRLISNISEIIIYKVKQKSVLIDIVSTIPFEVILFVATVDEHLETLMHLNRVLRIYRLFRLIMTAELNVWVSYIKIRLIKFSFLFMFILYLLSCFVYMHTCFKGCEKIGWYHYNKHLTVTLQTKTSYDLSPFIRSFDFVASMLLSLTWTNNYSYSIKDIVIEHLIIILGYFLFSFCFAELGACAALQLKAKREYQQYLKGLKHFMIRKNVPHGMKNFMYTVVQCQWQYNDRHEISGPKGILSDLPTHMKGKVFIQRLVKCMKMSPMFMHCDESTIAKIADLAKVCILPPGTIIMRENTIYTDLNFILRGYCKAESSIPSDMYHKNCTTITRGDCFPVIEVLMELKTFLKVTALTSVELITIPYSNLIVHLKTSFDFYLDLKKVIEAHMKENYVVLTRQKGRLPKLVSKKKAQGVGDFFSYETNEQVGVTEDKAFFDRTFNTLGKWKFIKHVLMRRTFIPTNKFYITWECIRCWVSFIHVLYTVFFMKFTIVSKIHRSHEAPLIFVGIIDFYIRMHTCYYTKDGILITHPLYTAKNYIRTSFLLDLFCIFPYEGFKLHHMFGRKNKKHALLYIANLTRPLLIYRIFNGITYIQEKSKEGRAILFHNIKYILLVFVLLGVLALFMQGLSCPFEDATRAFVCTNDSWLTNHDFINEEEATASTNTFISYYVVLSIFATCVVGLYTFASKKEIIIVLLLTFILFAMRWFALAKITSSRIGGNTMLVHYQNNMKTFLKYAHCNYVNKFLINEIVSHFEHIWKKTKGHNSTAILHSFHPVLHADFAHYLYAPSLKLCELFVGVETHILRYISMKIEELHFKKDAHIIRCNDIGSTVYIVHKGLVDITVANDKLCTLSPGGLFGCLAPRGITRQTICAKAVVHVDLLAIKGATFNKTINEFAQIKKKLKRLTFLNTEYILPVNTNYQYALNESERSEKNTSRSSKWFNFLLIDTERSWYHLYDYVVNVHIATISSIIISTAIAKVGSFDILKYKSYMYLVDVLFILKITIGFHLSYIDPESGVQVKEFKAIWKKYTKSLSGFWLDLVTCLPFEAVASFTKYGDIVYRLGWTNRTFRFLFMLKYYNNCRNTLTVSKHLRWSYLMYTLILLMHLMVTIWWKVSCVGEVCKYNKLISHEKIEFIQANTTSLSFRIAYQYVINIFTGTGLRNVAPTTTVQLIITVLMVCVALFTQLTLTIGFASMLLLEKFVMLKYERDTEHVLQYVKATKLSFSLKDKIWKYYVMLWTRGHGSWIPELIKTAPPYLKQDIMAELYGKYVIKHFLFRKTHVDFLRQLIVYLDLCVYMPGMYIAQKGDIDGCIYFIDEGEIIVYDIQGETEIEQLTLTRGKSFGEPQGLYETPHDRTYKAKYVSKVLVLKRRNWHYLLQWFPASKEYIIEQAARHFKKDTLPSII